MKARHLRLLLMVFPILSVLSLHAQEEDDHSPWSVTLAGGESMPDRMFPSTSESSSYSGSLSGNVRSGPMGAGMVEYELLPWLVGALQVDYARMPAEDLSEAELFPPCQYCGLGGGTSRTGYSLQQGEWTVVHAMGGLGLRGVEGRFSFGLRIEAGAQWTRSPEAELNEQGTLWILGDPNYGTYATRTVQPAVGAWSVVAGGGVDIAWAPGPRFALRLGGALHATTVNLPYTRETTNDSQWNAGTGPNTSHSSQSGGAEVQWMIANYQVTLGLTYRFPSWY